MPNSAPKCKTNARSGTWFARDNIANFLTWCRNMKVREEYMFETEGLGEHAYLHTHILTRTYVLNGGARWARTHAPTYSHTHTNLFETEVAYLTTQHNVSLKPTIWSEQCSYSSHAQGASERGALFTGARADRLPLRDGTSQPHPYGERDREGRGIGDI